MASSTERVINLHKTLINMSERKYFIEKKVLNTLNIKTFNSNDLRN